MWEVVRGRLGGSPAGTIGLFIVCFFCFWHCNPPTGPGPPHEWGF